MIPTIYELGVHINGRAIALGLALSLELTVSVPVAAVEVAPAVVDDAALAACITVSNVGKKTVVRAIII